MKNLLLGCLCIFFLHACTKDEGPSPLTEDYLIFGEYFGQCAGDCFTGYKIEDQKLFLDKLDYYQGNSPTFENSPLPDSDFEIAKVLLDEIPDKLFEDGSTIYGCPDCADQGGVYVELKNGNDIFIWNIDTYDRDLPASIIPFRNKVRDVIRELE